MCFSPKLDSQEVTDAGVRLAKEATEAAAAAKRAIEEREAAAKEEDKLSVS